MGCSARYKYIRFMIVGELMRKIKSIPKEVCNFVQLTFEKIKQNINKYKNMGFHDLAPTDELDASKEYFKALDWALKNDRITNIALSGPYGSGKSSIIQSYMKKHRGLKAINISLATFVELEEFNGEQSETKKPYVQEKLIDIGEKRIEEGVLKQLFYKVDHKRIPRSRYRKLYRVSKLKIFLGTILGLALIALGIAYFMPEIWEKAIDYVYLFGGYYALSKVKSWLVVLFFGLIVIWFFSNLLWILLTSYKVKEVNLADRAAITKQEESNESIFDKNMDEIIYFFEETNFKVVFIEDLDRFKSPEIFVRLRELNTILNNYEKIRRKIVFVYAIRDDMFIDKDRTKFFDFIIPIVPIINSTNSNEKLLELFGDEINEIDVEDNKHAITQEYIMSVSPYIDDMRVLINIYNEFLIYKNTLREEQKLDLEDIQMMSLMIFKNLRPNDFANLQMEKGVVKEAFKCKEKFAEKQIDRLEEDKNALSEQLKVVKDEILLSKKELKFVILCKLSEGTEMPTQIDADGHSYDFSTIMGEDFDLEKIYKSQLITKYRYNIKKGINGIEVLNEKANGQYSYIERWRSLRNNSTERIEGLRREVISISEKISKMRNISFFELCKNYELEDILDFNYEDNLFLIFALRNGYIDEKYANYINYFHANSITNSDMNFILNVRNHGGVNSWSSLNKIDQVIKRLSVFEFEQKEIYNFDLLEYMLKYDSNSEKCQRFIKQLSDEDERSWNFINTFIDLTKYTNKDLFIQMLGGAWKGIWDYIYNEPLLTDSRKLFYLELLLKNCSKEQIKGFDSNKKITDYFISKPDILQLLVDVEINRMKDVIEKLEIKFIELETEGVSEELLEWIFDNCYYTINLPMLQNIVKHKKEDVLNGLETANYTILRALEYPPVCEYIDDNFEDYIRDVVLQIPTNKFESEESVNIMIQKLQMNPDLCKEIIKKEEVLINDLSHCCLEIVEEKGEEAMWIWDTYLDTEKVIPSWKNVLFYFQYFKLTVSLEDFISAKIDTLMLDSAKETNIAFTRTILLHNFNISVYRKLIGIFRLEDFNHSLGDFTREQVDALIELKYFKMSPNQYADLKQYHPELGLKFIVLNKDDFIRQIEDYELEEVDVEELLDSNALTENEKKAIIEAMGTSRITEKMAFIIYEMTTPLEKEVVNTAWELLPKEKCYQLLLNQIQIFSMTELSEKFISLGDVYKPLADRTRRHTVKLFHSEYNEKLAKYLCKKGYLTSADNTMLKVMGEDEPYILCRVKQVKSDK